MKCFFGCQDTQPNDTELNDAQHKDPQHNDTYGNDARRNDAQNNIMPSVTSLYRNAECHNVVILLSVSMVSVVYTEFRYTGCPCPYAESQNDLCDLC